MVTQKPVGNLFVLINCQRIFRRSLLFLIISVLLASCAPFVPFDKACETYAGKKVTVEGYLNVTDCYKTTPEVNADTLVCKGKMYSGKGQDSDFSLTLLLSYPGYSATAPLDFVMKLEFGDLEVYPQGVQTLEARLCDPDSDSGCSLTYMRRKFRAKGSCYIWDGPWGPVWLFSVEKLADIQYLPQD